MAPPALRTLSTRVLAGFVVLILVFMSTMVSIVFYMNDLRSEIEVIRTSYLTVTIATKDLAGAQHNLVVYLEQDLPGEASPVDVKRKLELLRTQRAEQLDRVKATLDGLRHLPRGHGRAAIYYLDRLSGVQRAISALEPSYEVMQVVPPIDRLVEADPPQADPDALANAAEARVQIVSREKGLADSLSDLAVQVRASTQRIASNLEYNARRLRAFSAAMGIIAVLIGLLVTTWVTMSLRPLGRLRNAARRIAAGDYASRIEEKGPAEVADLAREFNAMGRAVEEREREVVRSERLAAVGKMAAMITHEVRNPLSSIALNSELLEEELAALDAGDEAKELCRAIGREVDRLTAITEEYLTFARLPKPRLATGSVAALVDDLARFVTDDLASRGVTLEVIHADGVAPALLDWGQIRQAVLNLVRNAAEAVHARGGGHVWIRTLGEGDQVLIVVDDDGPGIPPELRERIFDPFVSTKDGGTGLGLALTHQIIRDHGGTIAVADRQPQGTRFTLSLPRAAGRTADLPAG